MVITSIIVIIVNLVLLSSVFFSIFTICEEHLVVAIDVFITQYKVPEELAAVTLVAFGSAAPELLLNIVSVFQVPPSSDISISAVLGSALIAFGLIPSVVVLSSPKDFISFKPMPILRETSFYLFGLIMFLSSIVDGFVDIMEAIYLVGIYLVYVMSVYISYIGNNSENSNTDKIDEESHESMINESSHVIEDVEKIESLEISLYRRIELSCNHFVAENISNLWDYIIPTIETNVRVSKLRAFQVLIACIFIVGCHSFVLIYLSKILISYMHIDSSTMGATLISMGSEIPDLIGSIALMRRGYFDGAIASAIGSQVINITIGIGFPSIVLCLKGSGTFAIPINDQKSYEMLIGMLFGIIILYSSPLLSWLWRRKKEKLEINKVQGWILLAFYCSLSLLFVYYN